MSRGKKFDAAEKHFFEKRLEYERKIKYLQDRCAVFMEESNKYRELYQTINTENESLKDWVKRLLEYTELSEEDLRKAVERDKMVDSSVKIMLSFRNIMEVFK